MDFIKNEIATGVDYVSVSTNQFKTNELSVAMAFELKKETASINALMINLLSRKCAKYPSMLSLNKKLASLYGATLNATVLKLGECQVLKLGMTCLNDKFAIDNECISYECVKLLTTLLFEPNTNGFSQEDIDAEKRVLIEKIESEENEKRIYALNQTQKIMFANEPYGINRFGTIEDVEKITASDIDTAWQKALSSAKIMITTVGNIDTQMIENYLKSLFANCDRNYKTLSKSVFVPTCDNIKRETERIDVKQGKLVIGFRVNLKPDDKLTPAMRSFCDIFGGGPYSKLFANVREKMSLCYYCSARYTRLKSCILIQSGCNEENMDKATEEIMHQLDEIKNGNFDEEFKSSKVGLRDAILSVNDSPEILEGWYANQILDDVIKTPEMVANENDAVTKQDIIECAQLLSIDTIYKLTSLEEA